MQDSADCGVDPFGGWPSRTLTRYGMPHPWQFHGWAAANSACMAIGHCEIATFVVHRFHVNNLHRYYGARNSHFNYHKSVANPEQFWSMKPVQRSFRSAKSPEPIGIAAHP